MKIHRTKTRVGPIRLLPPRLAPTKYSLGRNVRIASASVQGDGAGVEGACDQACVFTKPSRQRYDEGQRSQVMKPRATQSSAARTSSIPPLRAGQRLTQKEFHR